MYLPTEVQSIPAFDRPVAGLILPNRFSEDCFKFSHMTFATIKGIQSKLLKETAK